MSLLGINQRGEGAALNVDQVWDFEGIFQA